MQSETMEPTTDALMLKRTVEKPASKEEKQTFWNDLRRFYRTGVKTEGVHEMKGLTSVFKKAFRDQNYPYPMTLGGKEVGLNDQTIYQCINYYQSNYQIDIKGQFKQKLQIVIDGLSKRLAIKVDSHADEENYDFATELIAFDKLAELVPKQKGEAYSAEDKTRLQEVLKQLKEGAEQYNAQQSILTLPKDFPVEESVLDGVKFYRIKQEDLLKEAKEKLKERMISFTSLIKAFRIASLEIDGDYQAGVHDDYFAYFNWYNLSESEKALFPPFIVLSHTEDTQRHLDDLSSLVSANWPVKLMIINQALVSTPAQQESWEEASHSARQELAALAISHRNVLTYQLSIADPEYLAEAMNSWIQSSHPAMIHLLQPKEVGEKELLTTKAAVHSRYFPSMSYQSHAKDRRWDISNNSAVEHNWLSKEFEVDTEGKLESLPLAFTYADHKAFYDQKVSELMLVPSAFESNNLVALADYIQLDHESIIGKIPYIWLVDEDQNIHRAAVPNVWVVSCQERLDFWNFLQEIAGSTSTSTEPVALKDQVPGTLSEDQLNAIKEEAVNQATQRLISELLS